MSLTDWTTVVSGAIGIFAFIWAIHRFTTKALVRDYLSELKPNGGGSIKDKVNDIDMRQQKLESRVDQIYFLIVTDKNTR